MKVCSRCKIYQPLSNFHKDIATKDKLFYYCKTCRLPVISDSKRRNNKIRDKDRARRDSRKYVLKYTYGITPQEAVDLLNKQNNKCAICLRTFSPELKSVIDHCHKTNKVRGILCYSCNIGLGFIEREGFVYASINYLQNSNTNKAIHK